MEVLTQTELNLREQEIVEKIKNGAIFIYPTDTIYGIGCNALNQEAVQKIRDIKERPSSPLSIWVPSKEWIKSNCVIPQKSLNMLPGPYTFIVPMKQQIVAENVSTDSIGIRIPDHWFNKIVKKVGFPIVTTSANKAGQPFMTCLENLDREIQTNVEFMIYEGEKKARPSKIINLTTNKITER